MNAEPQIAAYCAGLRKSPGPARHVVAPGRAREGDRTPSGNEAGSPKRFVPPAGGCCPVADPWPRRPRFAGTTRKPLESAAAVASRPGVIGLAALVLVAGLLRVAAHLGSTSGPVVVHLVWPA